MIEYLNHVSLEQAPLEQAAPAEVKVTGKTSCFRPATS